MARFVREAISDCEARLATWHGGNMRNAIPFKAEVVLTMPKENVESVKKLVEDWKADFEAEYKGIESGIEFFTEEVETPKNEVPEEIQDNLINAIYACHNGVMRMIPAIPTVVETSSNLAIIDIEGGAAKFKILARSSNEDMKEYIATTLESCFSMAGMKTTFSGSYGGWDPNTDSEILNLLLKEYKELFHEDGIVQVDHAGLECSVILSKYPNMDVVSFGPTLRSPHTTGERCEIASVAPFWQLITKTLEDVADK
jgi:dipeptidase D